MGCVSRYVGIGSQTKRFIFFTPRFLFHLLLLFDHQLGKTKLMNQSHPCEYFDFAVIIQFKNVHFTEKWSKSANVVIITMVPGQLPEERVHGRGDRGVGVVRHPLVHIL
jgi:hypothetical protein